MRPEFGSLRVIAFATGLVAAVLVSPAGAFEDDELGCRTGIAKSGGIFVKTALKAMRRCHEQREGSIMFVACNTIRSNRAENDFENGFNEACSWGVEVSASDILFEHCPAPCSGNPRYPSIMTNVQQVYDCMHCLVRDEIESFSGDVFGEPEAIAANDSEYECHAEIVRRSSKLFNASLKKVARCQYGFDREGLGTTDACTGDLYSELTSDYAEKCFAGIKDACENVPLPSATLDACGGATSIEELQSCVCETTLDRAGLVAADLTSLEIP